MYSSLTIHLKQRDPQKEDGMRTFAEWVLPGHPDKVSDRIADALVDASLALDQRALVGVEVAVHRNVVFIDGRIAAPGSEKIPAKKIAQSIIADTGYNTTFAPNPKKLEVTTDLCLGDFRPEERDVRLIADDQNIVTGYAELNPTTNHLPIAHHVAYTIARAFHAARRARMDVFGPDGKVFVVINAHGDSNQLEAVSFSIHHVPTLGTVEIIAHAKQILRDALQAFPFIQTEWDGGKTDVIVNGCGDFAVGGPEGDNGLSGKKLVIDAFGPHVPIGGGALSGKDPHKIDRCMALRARQIAKHLVVAGVAPCALVHLGFAPGDRTPRWQEIRFGSETSNGALTWHGADPAFAARWLSGYDLSIEGTFRDLKLGTIHWQELATWGHFTDPNLPWEQWNPGNSGNTERKE